MRSLLASRLGLLILVIVAFAPVFGGEFVRWDDSYTIHHNPRLNPPSVANLGHYWADSQHGELGLYIPFTYTVWSALAAVARVGAADPSGIDLNPWIFHAASVLIHAAGAICVFELIRRLIDNSMAALIGAAIWAVHPVQVDSVAWASGLKDVLAGTLGIASILLYVISAKTEAKRHSMIAYIACLACYVLAMLSKPSAVMVGPICLAIDLLMLRRGIESAMRGTLPLIIFAIKFAAIARRVQNVEMVDVTPLWWRPLIAGDALAFYVGKILFPLHLAIDYGRTPQHVMAQPMTYGIWFIPLLIAIVVIKGKSRVLQTAGCVFVLALLPVLGLAVFQFQQFSNVADHYLYVAMLGPALAAAWAIARWPRKNVFIAAGVIVMALAGKTFAQSLTWHDDFTLFPHTIAVNPRSSLAHHNLGTTYEALSAHEADRATNALSAGDSASAENHHAADIAALQRACDEYAAAIMLNPGYFDAQAHYPRALSKLGRHEEAAQSLKQSLSLRVKLPLSRRGDYAPLLSQLADNLDALNRTEEAQQYRNLYYELRPKERPATTEPLH